MTLPKGLTQKTSSPRIAKVLQMLTSLRAECFCYGSQDLT